MQPLEHSDMAKLAAAVARFERAWQEQTRRDGETIAKPCAGASPRRHGGRSVSSTPISTRGFFKKCCQS